MDINNLSKNGPKEFEYNMDRVKKPLSIGVFILFAMSFIRSENPIFNIVFFGSIAIILLYYFIWYRKKPPYIIISDNELIINKPPFFTRLSVKIDEIKKVLSDDKAIILYYSNAEETEKRIKIYRIFLDGDSQESITQMINTLVSN